MAYDLKYQQGPAPLSHRKRQMPLPTGVTLKLGWDTSTKKNVAIKAFDSAASSYTASVDDGGLREQIEFEVGSMARTNAHPNVVHLLDVVTSASNVCLIMEAAAVVGSDLMEEITSEGSLGDDAARFYFGQLLDAVEHIHSRGVCHRDIRPECVRLDEESGSVKLTGFARAGLTDANDLSYASSETPLNNATPEVIEGSKHDGSAADVWSLGVTLYTMLAGFSPFEIDEAKKTRGYDHKSLFEAAPGVRPSARSLLEGMLKSDPRRRYTIEMIRSHPWFTQKRGDIGSRRRITSSIRSTSSCSSSYLQQ